MTAEHLGREVRYDLLDNGTFLIENYNHATPFSSFLPGIAGLWGVPLWCYYVNRGQAVACFGTADKNGAILEFESANHHYRRVGQEGFRTFIRRCDDGRLYEPFRADQPQCEAVNRLEILGNTLRLVESNRTWGLDVAVEYFPVPGEPFAALARQVTITNPGDAPAKLEVLDGLAKFLPFYIEHQLLKFLPYITEAYLQVRNLEGRVPFANLKALSSDESETGFVDDGHFFLGFEQGKGELLAPIVDSTRVFGGHGDWREPYGFLAERPFDPTGYQAQHCMTPAAFLHWPVTVPAGGTVRLRSLFGRARRLDALGEIVFSATSEGWWEAKADEAELEVRKVRDVFFQHGSDNRLNRYGAQTFLDNVLRGGLPLSLPAGERRQVFHVYSRRHGDLERDYNNFQLSPTYFSQGNGAYRDINQNRRNDIWFNPDVGAENLVMFLDLLQPDGFNPLVIHGARFEISDEGALEDVLTEAVPADVRANVRALLSRPFSPGEMFAALEEMGVEPALPREAFLERLLAIGEKTVEADFEAGYWIDHWFYNFDLLESYLAIFPERLGELLVQRRDLTYWDNDVRVKPRDAKYVLTEQDTVRHIESLFTDQEKRRLIDSRPTGERLVRTGHGRGEVYRTNMLEKVLCLLGNKAASLSPSGVGVEMDGGRPGWHDSINGIPSLFGASTSECYQLIRAAGMLLDALEQLQLGEDFSQAMPVEVARLCRDVTAELRNYLEADATGRDILYWDRTNDLKEAYREAVRFGFDGATEALSLAEIREFLTLLRERIRASLDGAVREDTNLPATYVTHQAEEYEPITEPGPDGEEIPKLGPRGLPCVRVARFSMHRYPLFLEAPMHANRIESEPEAARRRWRAVRESPLFDRELKMYLLADSVQNESRETGRIYAWPPGWFENENVFTHMEHKYLLSTLCAGLYDEFFEDFCNCLVPYQPQEVFARSPLENVSFIVSSRHPRPDWRGRGCLPRSSGTTAEVLHMLLVMSFGRKPFRLAGGELRFALEPVLPGWMFTDEPATRELTSLDGTRTVHELPAGSYSALFLGGVLVTYLNPERRDTFGDGGVAARRYRLIGHDGVEETIEGASLGDTHARDIRDRKVARIEVEME